MPSKDKFQRVCGFIPKPMYMTFKNLAGNYFHFKKGYTQRAVESSIRLWVWMMSAPKETEEALKKIAEKEFNHIEDPIKRHETMIEQAIDEFIENHKEE